MTKRHLVKLAWKSLLMHPLRSFLTVLGIVCGVMSVVTMLAVGEGASQEAQEQIRRMGSRNLLVSSVAPASGDSASDSNSRVLAYGILRSDLERIRDTVPGITRAVARRDIPVDARYGSRKYEAVLMGTSPDYADVANLRLRGGRFLTAADGHDVRSVCVLGAEISRRLFLGRSPVGLRLRIKNGYYAIVGVMARRGEGTGGTAGTGGESDSAIYIPLSTMHSRFGETITHRSSGSFQRERVELHRITIESGSLESVPRIAAALRSLIEQAHPKDDVRLTVPLELMRQAEETEKLFNFVLGTIAAISLLVGGIGIMNIMLATVVERTREVGIRRALGARRGHIISQFLAETVLLSIGGGAMGLLLGLAMPAVIEGLFGVRTVVTAASMILAFAVSAFVGVAFGLYPAARAADLDPVEALRRE